MIWDFFDDIICISLRNRMNRRDQASQIFKELGIPVTFFIVDKHPNGGIYGCFDSHIKIVQYMQKNNKNNILIFEDDVEPTASFDISHIENAVKFMKLNQNWDLFYLGYFPFNYEKIYLTSLNINDNIIQYNPFATHAYCINKRAIPKILTNYNSFIGKIHIDHYFSRYTDLTNYCYTPIIFDQKLCEDHDVEPNNLIEYVARSSQCVAQEKNILWKTSMVKYYLNVYFIILILCIMILLLVILFIIKYNNNL